jgi:hypothetical protein
MRDRARLPVSIVLGALAGVAALVALPAAALPAVTPEIVLRLEDLDARMRSGSPRAQYIDQQPELVAAGRAAALSPSAPMIGYDLEDADGRREWQLTLGKRFERPFAQGALRAAWDREQRAALFRQEQATGNLLTGLRADYVRLALLRLHRRDLDRLSGMVELAAGVARERHASGILAGTEARLLGLSAQSVAAIGRRLEAETRGLESTWRADLGLPADGPVRLASEVGFAAFPLPDPQRLAELAAARPGLRALAERTAALADHARSHRAGLLPALEAYGGFRRFGGEADGIVAGLAVDLPVGGREAAIARQYAAEQALAGREFDLALTLAGRETAALCANIAAAQPGLAAYSAELFAARELPEALLVSFREGALSLESLLDAVQVQAAALDSYYAELEAHYDHLFRLEAVTGEAIVSFPAQE